MDGTVKMNLLAKEICCLVCSWNLQNEYFRGFSIPSGDLSRPLFV
jgi:hypothetical protein